MDTQLLVICILTFIIHLIGTLAYAARIAGVRTRRIAISFSLFNILILVSRTSNSFQGPFLAKRIENNIALGPSHGLLADFRWMLWSATLTWKSETVRLKRRWKVGMRSAPTMAHPAAGVPVFARPTLTSAVA